jgi:hypothetical protein
MVVLNYEMMLGENSSVTSKLPWPIASTSSHSYTERRSGDGTLPLCFGASGTAACTSGLAHADGDGLAAWVERRRYLLPGEGHDDVGATG